MDRSLYCRPNKPKFKEPRKRLTFDKVDLKSIKDQYKPIEVHSGSECHITPSDVAGLMVDYLCVNNADTRILEPSAGTGSLIQALLEYGCHNDVITAIEREYSLYSHLQDRFNKNDNINIINACFLEESTSLGLFDRVIINPPFKQAKKHIENAKKLLNDDGVMVALVPSTFKDDEAEFLEDLPNTTFANAKVFTKLIRIYKED